MSSPNGKLPLVERPASASSVSSPAHKALKSNLEAAGVLTLSLSKKTSWMGSLRDVVRKGTWHAKTALDIFRSDQQKNERSTERTETESMDLEKEAGQDHETAAQHKPMDSIAKSTLPVTTPVPNDSEHRPTFMSRVNATSIRQHISSHSNKKKRASVNSVASRPSGEMVDIMGPERFEENVDIQTHTRRTSVADSIVGSIRGIGRRTSKAKKTRASTKNLSSKELAENVPLPSSPINIPAAAPSLDLDLGPTGFNMPPLGCSPGKNREERAVEVKRLKDSAIVTTGLPPPTSFLGSGRLPMLAPRHDQFRPVAPRDFLKIQIDDVEPTLAPGPSTPMPGTSFTLELDGAESERSLEMRVFERSITPSLERDCKHLRKIQSLDAMAQACAVAHANDELANVTELPSSKDTEANMSLTNGQALKSLTPRRNNRSSETTHTLHCCPSDMQKLSRQCTPKNARVVGVIVAESAPDLSKCLENDDPFDDRNAINLGPPSPDRTIKLPFRPNIRPVNKVEDKMNEMCRFEIETLKADTIGTDSLRSIDKHSQSPLWTATGQAEMLFKGNADPFHIIAPNDDTHSREQQLATADMALLDHNFSAAAKGLSSDNGTLALRIDYPSDADQYASPRGFLSRTVYTTDPGNTEHKFSFDNWIRESTSAAPPESEPTTPHRRRMETSLDSVSISEDREMPQISPTTITSGRTPSMGDRLDFELKRSERNTRYNALQQDQLPVLRHIVQPSRRGPPRFIFGASDETDVTGIHLANFDSAYAGSCKATPQSNTSDVPGRVGSNDSVADSLKNAAYEYSQLEERLADVSRTDGDIFADPTSDGEPADLADEGSKVTKISHGDRSNLKGVPEQPLKDECEHRTNSQEELSFRFEMAPTSRCGLTASVQSSPLPTHPQMLIGTHEVSHSTADCPIGVISAAKDDVASSDPLDRSLKLSMSSESGYQADASSVCEPTLSASKTRLARFCSNGRQGGQPLS